MPSEQLLREAATLPVQERVWLIDHLIESLDQECGSVSESLSTELDRRSESARRNPELGEPWEVVRERLRQGLSHVQARRPA